MNHYFCKSLTARLLNSNEALFVLLTFNIAKNLLTSLHSHDIQYTYVYCVVAYYLVVA